MNIPLLTSETILAHDLEALMQIGFCYVKLPNEVLTQVLSCLSAARQFFKSPYAEKAKWQLKADLQPGERYQGFTLRTQPDSPYQLEQLFFEPDAPFGPYQADAARIQVISEGIMQQVFKPILAGIYQRLKLSEIDWRNTINEPNRSLVFQYCPSIPNYQDVTRFNVHKDFGLLTVVYFEEAGLEVNYQDRWHPIMPKPNCVVVNLGNALELITGGHCHSPLHRVFNAPNERTSMVYFINPNYQRPVRNLMNGSIIAENGEEFFKAQFRKHYEIDH